MVLGVLEMQNVTADNPGSWDNRTQELHLTRRQNILIILGLLTAVFVAILANNSGLYTGAAGSAERRYADVTPQSPFYTPAEHLASMGLFGGYACGQLPHEPCDEKERPYFRWGESVKRKELARLLVMADDARNSVEHNGSTQPPAGKQTYSDVPPTHPNYRWIEEATSRGFMRGYSCGSVAEPCDQLRRPYFRRETAASRAELAFSIHQADQKILNNPIIPLIVTFQDVPKEHPYWLHIERLYDRGIVSGYVCGGCSPSEPCVPPDNRSYFRPNAPATNGQVARAITNSLLNR